MSKKNIYRFTNTRILNVGKQSIIEQIAKKNNTAPDEIRREMEIAIDHAWENSPQKMRELFKSKPTPEEFILKSVMLANDD
ncbi:MAG: sporulation initiation factor Spo0A C-terminal domain-containing protein [Firmicutes bacterium]|nr:sporulation initiation factor Spo0A C-terminal domain-containing protein [Bacillota bacterium]